MNRFSAPLLTFTAAVISSLAFSYPCEAHADTLLQDCYKAAVDRFDECYREPDPLKLGLFGYEHCDESLGLDMQNCDSESALGEVAPPPPEEEESSPEPEGSETPEESTPHSGERKGDMDTSLEGISRTA
jgi:hypothetical protein